MKTLLTALIFAAMLSGALAQSIGLVTDTNGNVVSRRTNALTFTNPVTWTTNVVAATRTNLFTGGLVPSGAATSGSSLQADGTGGSSFVANRTQTVTMTNSAFRTNTVDGSLAVNGQTNMALSVDANSTYLISYSFIITSPTTGGWAGNLQTTPGTNVFIDQYIGRQGRPINVQAADWTASSTVSGFVSVNFVRTNMAISGYGVLQTGTNAGTITLVWWQNTTNATATELQAGSTMSITRIRP